MYNDQINILKQRKVYTLDSTIVGDDSIYFLLYDFFGTITGYQRYVHGGLKQPNKHEYRNEQDRIKYKTIIFDNRYGFFGLHSITDKTKTLYIVEGIFDAIMLHQKGFACIALLGNDVLPLKTQLYLLRCKYNVIAICDDDSNGAGKKLAKFAHSSITVNVNGCKDLNDMQDTQLNEFIKEHKLTN